MKLYAVFTMLLITILHQNSTASAYRRTMSAPIRIEQNKKFPLHEMVRNHECYDFAELLKKNYDPNKQTQYGMTAMHIAAECNYPNMVSKLLQHKANPNITNAPLLSQRTPLHLAILNLNVPVVIILAQHPSTDLAVQDIKGKTAVQLVRKNWYKVYSKKQYDEFILLLTPKK